MQYESLSGLLIEFEKEIWLYLDGDLPESRIAFWDDKIKENPELLNLLNETKEVLNLYNSEALEEMDPDVFENTIASVTKERGLLRRLKMLLGISPVQASQAEFSIQKVAFGGVLAVAAIVLLLLSENPNTVKSVGTEILDWDAAELTSAIDKMGVSISYLKNDNLEHYYQYQNTTDKWSRDIYILKQEIEDLKEETTNK